MTGEQIEKALSVADDIAISEEVDCRDVIEYINRLKEEITRKAEKEIIRWLFEHAYYSEQEELVKACAETFDVDITL